jgi:transcriptional regulator with XRE-family HTH domain
MINPHWRQKLVDRIQELGMSNADVCRIAGMKSSMLSDILGAKQATPSIANALKIAQAVNFSLQDLFTSDDNQRPYATLIGSVKGAGMWEPSLLTRPEFVELDVFALDLVWLRVDSHELRPAYQMGDLLGGPKTVGRSIHNLSGTECIIETKDGTRLVRFLQPDNARDRYILRSRDPLIEDVANVQLAWVAPIRVIMRTS